MNLQKISILRSKRLSTINIQHDCILSLNIITVNRDKELPII